MAADNLRKQLAVAVRSIQWSYAIFWSLSTKQQGVLEWGDGYYNGDIKTRKTVQSLEVKPDKIGLQRSEQLRELYKSLEEEDESEEQQQGNRPIAALSPEDLSDTEWYYLVCMSFVFTPGQSLPGKALANKETIWLCNAQYADSKVFSRSLLAKSASIQTVVCFPHLDGVIELGVTELVPEDPNLVQHIKASLLDFSKPICYVKSLASKGEDDDKDPACAKVNPERPLDIETLYSTPKLLDEALLEGQNCHFMDDETSHGFLDSVNSSNCTSEGSMYEEKPVISSLKDDNVTCHQLNELLEGVEENDYLHYRRTLSMLLGSSTKLLSISCFSSVNNKSSFRSWKKEAVKMQKPKVQQKVLKKVLFTVPLMHGGHFIKENRGNDEQRENEKFLALKSLIPSVNKIDKASILDDMIMYLKELKARVEELESSTKPRKNCLEMAEQISDNSDDNSGNCKKLWINKRKVSEIYETDPTVNNEDNGSPNVKISIKDKEVAIELKCAYREYILLDIMDEINNLNLDAISVQSSTVDGILSLSLKSKFRGAAVASARMIKEALWKIGCI